MKIEYHYQLFSSSNRARSVIRVGAYTLQSRLALAPMAGVTDQPFRKLCRSFGAALTPSEMVTSNVKLWQRDKCRLRRCHAGEPEPRVVQIAGADPAMMAEAARLNVAEGAQVIDMIFQHLTVQQQKQPMEELAA